MQAPNSWYFLVLPILFLLFEIGSCLRCYSCVAINANLALNDWPEIPPQLIPTNSCIDGSDLSKVGIVNCVGPNRSCFYSIIPLIEDVQMHTRSCQKTTNCTVHPFGGECSSCDKDLCNSGGFKSSAPCNVVPSLLLQCIGLVFAVVLYR